MTKLTLPRTVTKRIVELWGIGATAEETVKALHDENITISLHTVYIKRRSLTAQEMIDELIRKQLRDITTSDGEIKLKYRDKLLEKLIPQRIESLSLNKTQTDINVNYTDTLKLYTAAIENAVNRDFEALRARKQMDTPETPNPPT